MIYIDSGQGSIRIGGQGKPQEAMFKLRNDEQVKIWRVGAPGREKSKYQGHKVRMRFHIQEKENYNDMPEKEKGSLKGSSDFILIAIRIHWTILRRK